MTLSEKSKKEVDVTQLQYESRETSDLKPLPEDVLEEHYSMIEAMATGLIANRRPPVGIDLGDMVSWGVEGLHKAYNNYKSTKGTTFKTYAYYRIKGEILDSLRKEWKYRFPQSYKETHKKIQDRIADIVESVLNEEDKGGVAETPISVLDIISQASTSSLISMENFDEVLDHETQKDENKEEMLFTLQNELKTLDEEEKTIVNMFYVHNMTQKEIAAKLSFSPSKVCRIHMKLLEKLKRRLSRETK